MQGFREKPSYATSARQDRSTLIVNPSARMSYRALQQWLDEHLEGLHVDVLGQQNAADLASAIAPRRVRVVPPIEPRSWRRRPYAAWRSLLSLVHHYDTVVVLCVSDEQAIAGDAPYRVVGEALFSSHLVLIGPHAARPWPAGRALLRLQRAREVLALAMGGAACVLLVSTVVAAVIIQEWLTHARLQR